jgi:hypothetical protein
VGGEVGGVYIYLSAYLPSRRSRASQGDEGEREIDTRPLRPRRADKPSLPIYPSLELSGACTCIRLQEEFSVLYRTVLCRSSKPRNRMLCDAAFTSHPSIHPSIHLLPASQPTSQCSPRSCGCASSLIYLLTTNYLSYEPSETHPEPPVVGRRQRCFCRPGRLARSHARFVWLRCDASRSRSRLWRYAGVKLRGR